MKDMEELQDRINYLEREVQDLEYENDDISNYYDGEIKELEESFKKIKTNMGIIEYKCS